MSSSRFQLQTVLDLAQNEADASAARLGQATARLVEADRKLKLLLDYHDEYQAKFRASVAGGLDSAGWSNFHAFMDKLESAIEAARAQAATVREAAVRTQTEWHACQRKLKAFGVLAERHQRGLDAVEAKREQRAADEHTTSVRLRRPPALGGLGSS